MKQPYVGSISLPSTPPHEWPAVRSLTGQSSPAAQIGALHALAAEAKKAKTLGARIAKLEGDGKKKAHEAKVASAIKAGKLAPAQKAWALSVDPKRESAPGALALWRCLLRRLPPSTPGSLSNESSIRQ